MESSSEQNQNLTWNVGVVRRFVGSKINNLKSMHPRNSRKREKEIFFVTKKNKK